MLHTAVETEIMKKIFIGVLAVVLVAIAAVKFFGDSLRDAAVFSPFTEDMFVTEDADAFEAGLPVGNTLPAIEAMYDGSTIDNLQQFSGEKGLIVIVSRSMDWCIFCIRQAVELNQVAQQFEDAGLGIVLVTYDSPEKQQTFIDKYGITYPLISDVDAETISALQTLRPDYSPGDENYGIPYPGTFVTTPDGYIAGKWFLEGYDTRIDAQQVLDDSLQILSTF